VYGELDTHDAHTRRIANRTRSAVLGVGYRKAPEHPFPAGLTDCDRAATWLRDHATATEHGLKPRRMVAVGDSAGATLAQAVTLRHPGWFAAQVLAYPFLDPEGATYDDTADLPELGLAEAAWYWAQYAPDPSARADPELDPLRAADFSRQPPTLIQLAELDILATTGRELARRMAADGVVPEVVHYPGVPHGFWRRTERYPQARQSLLDIAAFLDRVLPAVDPGR
jgi:acetyl esterase